MKKKKHKKKKNITLAEQVRRENELKMYGRILSLRPSHIHKSGKEYTRKKKHKNEISE